MMKSMSHHYDTYNDMSMGRMKFEKVVDGSWVHPIDDVVDDEEDTERDMDDVGLNMSHPQPPPRRMKGARNYTGTLYLLFQTLVISSLITESKYHIQRYKIKLPL